MPDEVKLIECPRDAWQGLKGQIPTDLKVDYLKALISAGFKHIDAVSLRLAKRRAADGRLRRSAQRTRPARRR